MGQFSKLKRMLIDSSHPRISFLFSWHYSHKSRQYVIHSKLPALAISLFLCGTALNINNSALANTYLDSDSYFSNLENKRKALLARKAIAYGQFIYLIDKYPDAAIAVATTIGSAAWASAPDVDKDMKTILGGIAIVGAISCLLDADCRTMANKLVELSNELNTIHQEITSITAQVGNRLYVRNNCRYSIIVGVQYQALDNSSQSAGWWTVNASKGRYLSTSDGAIRMKSGGLYYYAESKKGQPHVSWEGDYKIRYGSASYNSRHIVLELDAEHDYTLALNCN